MPEFQARTSSSASGPLRTLPARGRDALSRLDTRTPGASPTAPCRRIAWRTHSKMIYSNGRLAPGCSEHRTPTMQDTDTELAQWRGEASERERQAHQVESRSE